MRAGKVEICRLLLPLRGCELASSPQVCLTSDHASYPPRDLIRRWRKLRECLLEIDGDSNLVIQRSRLLPCAGDQRIAKWSPDSQFFVYSNDIVSIGASRRGIVLRDQGVALLLRITTRLSMSGVA
jgi:hypothetical protein